MQAESTKMLLIKSNLTLFINDKGLGHLFQQDNVKNLSSFPSAMGCRDCVAAVPPRKGSRPQPQVQDWDAMGHQQH